MTTILVWHRADLRTADNRALAAACEDGDRVAPAFVVDPRYYGPDGLACDARPQFLHDCLDDLDSQYRDRGSSLALLQGDPRERLRTLLDDAVDTVYYNRHPTARYGKRVPDEVRSWPETTAFADDGIRYAAERSSRLSPRQVYQRVQQCSDGRGTSMFVSRLYWNRHYHQKLADWPGWTDRAVNPVFRGLFRDEHDPDLDRVWREGQTGFPMVDAAMRALTATGYINCRIRALVATVYVYVLKQWWKRGADFMYAHLVDADAAINYTQWQSQCNLTGVHPVRVYDPAKQQREYDSDGEFVRKYVPELASLPDEHLARPEQTPVHAQRECGVDVGTDYPYPVVDYDHEADRARQRYADLADRVREALSDPQIRRRCSFSNRGRDRTDGDDDSRGQASLTDF